MERYQKEYKKWLDRGLVEPIEDKKSIKECFGKQLKFGTGGIRAIMGPGTNRLNIYTIRQIAMGFADYVNCYAADNNLIIIGYDNRKNSKLFAKETAKVLSSQNINVKLFPELRPTPELSFAIRNTGAFGGVVITASHNPKQYNGFKTYDNTGCQHPPTVTCLIAKHIAKYNDLLNIKYKEKPDLLSVLNNDVEENYFTQLKNVELRPEQKKDINIVYTPLHGTGNFPVTEMLKRLNYSVFKVNEQSFPSEDFAYADSVNPEDREAFTLAEKLAFTINAELIIATDPDCDRIGVACFHNKEYQYLTGNQLGAIFIDYLLRTKKANNDLVDNAVIYDTVVTGSLGARIAKSYGVEVISTLTGFKYIGEQIEINKNRQFIFGYEESYGYLIKDFCRDKDGVQAAIFASEVCQYYKNIGMTLIDALNELYKKYGYLEDTLESQTFDGPDGIEKIDEIVGEYRNLKEDIFEGKKIVAVEDYLKSIRYENNAELPITLPKTNMIKLFLEDESWVAIRPSGNEPKLKIYKNMWKKFSN